MSSNLKQCWWLLPFEWYLDREADVAGISQKCKCLRKSWNIPVIGTWDWRMRQSMGTWDWWGGTQNDNIAYGYNTLLATFCHPTLTWWLVPHQGLHFFGSIALAVDKRVNPAGTRNNHFRWWRYILRSRNFRCQVDNQISWMRAYNLPEEILMMSINVLKFPTSTYQN